MFQLQDLFISEKQNVNELGSVPPDRPSRQDLVSPPIPACGRSRLQVSAIPSQIGGCYYVMEIRVDFA
eukprot:5900894-Prymnesium_polylepis.1